MTRVELVGSADDGENLVIATATGEQYTLPVTEDLRDILNPPRNADDAPTLAPKDIQRRIRAGLSAEELSELTGVPLDKLRRYEAPVLAERHYIAEMAQATRIGRDPSSPILGELVSDRLASRGITGARVTWDAWRNGTSPWTVAASYPLAGGNARAVWTFDHQTRSVKAQDDEARWLTETDLLTMPAPTRHLAPVRETAPGARAPVTALHKLEARPEKPARPSTDRILEDLQAKRGTRDVVETAAELEDQFDEEFEGFGPQHAREADVGFASGGGSAVRASAPPAGGTPPTRAPAAKPTRKGRASVPSWDEIVFGAKSD